MFPAVRPRRLRRTGALRGLVRETRLSPESFVYPLFVQHGEGVREPISTEPSPSEGRISGSVLPLFRERERAERGQTVQCRIKGGGA